MPLIKSGSRAAVSTNIREMIRAGHPRNQAIAAALSTARRYGRAEGGKVSQEFPSIEGENRHRRFDMSKLRQYRPTENIDPQFWQDENEIPHSPLQQDPDYELGWEGHAKRGGRFAEGGDVPDDEDTSLADAYDPKSGALKLTVHPKPSTTPEQPPTPQPGEASFGRPMKHPVGPAAWNAEPPEQSIEPHAPVAEELFGLHGVERYHTAPEKMFIDPARKVMEKMASGTDPFSPEAVESSTDLAASLFGGIHTAGALKPSLIPKNAAGMFVGHLHPGQVEKAMAMRDAGAPKEAIWEQARVHFDPFTGVPIREIPDRDVKLNAGLLEPDKYNPGLVRIPEGRTLKLGDLYPHDELYSIYPWARDINVEGLPAANRQISEGIEKKGGANWPDNKITLGPTSLKDFKAALTHEVQHFIQFHEGMTPGAGVGDFIHPADRQVGLQLAELNRSLTADLQKSGIPLTDAAQALRRFDALYKAGKLSQLSSRDSQILQYLKHAGKIDDLHQLVNSSVRYNDIMNRAWENYKSVYGEAMARAAEERMGRSALENELEHPESTIESMANEAVPVNRLMPSLRAVDQPWKYDPEAYKAFHGVEPLPEHTAIPAASESYRDPMGGFDWEKFESELSAPKSAGDIIDHFTKFEERTGREFTPNEIAEHLIQFAKEGHGDAAFKAKNSFPADLKQKVNKAIFALKNGADAGTLNAISNLYSKKAPKNLHLYKAPKKKDITEGLIPEPNPREFDTAEQAKQAIDEEYYKAQEQQAMQASSPEWKPEGAEAHPDIFEDMFSQPQAKHLPPHIFEKAKVLGLNQPGYHGSTKAFEEFKLPEELPVNEWLSSDGYWRSEPVRPEIGIHFGTVKAANDRIIQHNIFLKNPHMWKGQEFHIVPAIIKAERPFRLPDLGTWKADNIAYGLRSSSLIDRKLIDAAMNVPESPKPWKAYYDWDREVKQIKNLRNLLEKEGYDSIAYRNNVEDPGSISYITWRPNHVRSFYAKFKPGLKHLANLASGIGGMGVFAMGAKPRGEQEEEPMIKRASGGNIPFHLRGYQESIGAPRASDEPGVRHFTSPHVGMIHSPVPGRTDKISMNVKGGSYILPADIVSGVGQGNSMAGSSILNHFFKMGPYGDAMSKMATPKVNYGKPMNMKLPTMKIPSMKAPKFAAGGIEEEHSDKVPIVAAGGEFTVPPEVVQRIGGGSMKKGHDILDHFVLHLRKKVVKEIKGLKPPKK